MTAHGRNTRLAESWLAPTAEEIAEGGYWTETGEYVPFKRKHDHDKTNDWIVGLRSEKPLTSILVSRLGLASFGLPQNPEHEMIYRVHGKKGRKCPNVHQD